MTFMSCLSLHQSVFQHASEDVVKILVGNKSDKTTKRVVSRERGEMMALQHGIKYETEECTFERALDSRFYETSAQLNENIDKAFYELAEAILVKVSPVLVSSGQSCSFRCENLQKTSRSKTLWCQGQAPDNF